MILAKLLCYLPPWLGGGHKWRRLTVNERRGQIPAIADPKRICRRCGAERVVKTRKAKETKQETGNG